MKALSEPTPYPDVNALLHELLARTQAVLGDAFVGLYLYGSLASGDFDPQRSDIDFVVVTRAELRADQVMALDVMHAALWAGGFKWAAKLEGSYLPRSLLRAHDPHAAPCAQVNEGRFVVAALGSDWIIQRHILREHGVTVAGPPVRAMVAPVTSGDLRRAVRGVLREWWAPMLDDPGWVTRTDYQAFAVLTMCRALYTLAHGDVVSKPAAARWAQTTLGEPWASLIADALRWQPGKPFDRLPETLALMRFTLARADNERAPL